MAKFISIITELVGNNLFNLFDIKMIANKDILAQAQRVFNIEIEALRSVSNSLNSNFVAAVQLILKTRGNVIFSGVGKSGHVGRKLAATFSSTGTPAYFIHSDEAAHGDLGMVRSGDLFIGISHSGESSELRTLIPALKEMNIPIIIVTGNENSSLAKIATISLIVRISREACPLNLAPTASTTATMALGDALAGVLMVAKNFNAEQFARTHPAGALGRRLLLRVSDVMKHIHEVPVVHANTSAAEAIIMLARGHLGCVVVIDSTGEPLGIYTEGDLARSIRSSVDFALYTVNDIMIRHPKVISIDDSAYESMQLIRKFKINQLIVLKQGKVAGLVHVQDLIRFGIS